MTDDELRGMLNAIIEENRQIIAMLSGQWTAFGGFTPHGQSNTYGQAQIGQFQEQQDRGKPR